MQRILLSSSRLSCCALATARTQRQIITRSIAGQTPTAAEIKKNVPELWVRKMKTFFAFYVDVSGDGMFNFEHYKQFESMLEKYASANNVSSDRIKKFKTSLYEMWAKQIGAEEDFQWTENKFLEAMFKFVSRPGAEEYLRQAASDMFDLTDLNQDGFISKEEHSVILGGSPWTIVAFSSVDTNHNGKVSREEFVQTYLDFWFNFADETNPSKHLMCRLVDL